MEVLKQDSMSRYFSFTVWRFSIVISGYSERVVLAGIRLMGLTILLWLLLWQY